MTINFQRHWLDLLLYALKDLTCFYTFLKTEWFWSPNIILHFNNICRKNKNKITLTWLPITAEKTKLWNETSTRATDEGPCLSVCVWEGSDLSLIDYNLWIITGQRQTHNSNVILMLLQSHPPPSVQVQFTTHTAI